VFDLVPWLLAALNRLDVMACDLENTYLNAPCMEKKSAGALWHATLAQALHDIGFVSTVADPDVWI
jgi:hypothetical protein